MFWRAWVKNAWFIESLKAMLYTMNFQESPTA
jgi:hypothetical protein